MRRRPPALLAEDVDPETLVGTGQLAELLGIRTSSLSTAYSKGWLPRPDLRVGTRVYWHRSTVDACLLQPRRARRSPRTVVDPEAVEAVGHGIDGYDLGCRCPTCRRARAQERAAQLLEQLRADPGDPRHGAKGGRAGCTCARCDQARAAASRGPRARRLAALLADPDHPKHGDATWAMSGCPCPPCRSAASGYLRSRALARLAELRADPDHPRHGRRGYADGCRCERCRDDHARRESGTAPRRRLEGPLSARAVAAQIGITAMTVAKWRRDGVLPEGRPLTRTELSAARARAAKARRPQRAAHGTPSRWRAGCDCDRCRAAKNTDTTARRRAAAPQIDWATIAPALLDAVARGESLAEAAAAAGLTAIKVSRHRGVDPDFAAALDAALMAGRDPSLRHGSASAWKMKCRCPECRSGHARTSA